jgi:TonB-linked SusC/RagA family outer membrane protein
MKNYLSTDYKDRNINRPKFAPVLVNYLIIIFLIFQSTNAFCQSSTMLSLKVKDATIIEIFRQIEKTTGYGFFFRNEDMDTKKLHTFDIQDLTLEAALKIILQDELVDYRIENQNVVISKSSGVKEASNQELHITGKVIDKNSYPVIGASVLVKGTVIGAITDLNGKYQISSPPDAILIFSFIGMQTVEISINNRTVIDATLQEELIGLDEVIVVGYGTMKKRDINAAISSVKPEDLLNVSSANVVDLLAGRAAGVTIIQGSAQPGGNTNIFIRGAASTGAGNDPLFVIDGFPVVNTNVSPGSGNQYSSGSHNPLNDINPNDIASIEILKDASATAIYGARGSNGVILITTKRGGIGTKVEYSYNSSVQSIINQPELLNAQEYMIEQNNYLYERFLMIRNALPYGTKDPTKVGTFIPKNSETDILNAGEGTNWYDLITRLGKVNQHNLTIRGGNEKTKSLLSLNYFNQTGVVKTSDLKRYSLRYNLDQKITNWWDIGISSSASLVNESNATLGDGRDATSGIIESAMNYSPFIKAERDPITGTWIEDPNQPLLNHPLSFLDIQDFSKTKRFLMNAFTNIYISKNLWVKVSGGFDVRNGQRQNYYPQTTRYGKQIGGDANINVANRDDYQAEAILNYQKVFKEKHNILALAGYSLNNQNGDGVYTRAMGFTSDALSYYALQAGEQIPIVSSYKSNHILASYLTRLQYSYDNRYLFTFTGRVDGSDRFGANNRYAFFPSGAFAWRMGQESFMKEVEWVSDLKIRLSVGQVGNENIANDASSEYYAFQGRDYVFSGVERLGVNLAKIGNPNLKWETTTEMNFGVDYGFFRNRINGSIELFYKEIADLLTYRTLPINSIIGNIPWNVGKTQSKGLEFSLKTINLTGQFHWESLFTYTSFRDKWLDRDPKVILLPYQGAFDPIRAVFALTPDGIKQAGELTPTMPTLRPGQQKFKDINGLDENGNLTGAPDGKISEADAIYIGTQDPKFTAGIYNSFRFKGFDLNVFLYASYGSLKWPTTRIEHSVYGSYGVQQFTSNYNYLKEVQNRWSSKNMESSMPNGEVNSSTYYGAPFWENASYVRLKDLSLGYNFSGLLKNNLIQTARLYIGIQNLFTITNYKGLDPEVENSRAAYPQQQTYSIGCDFKF